MPNTQPKVSLPVAAVADLQDSLLVVMNDLQRLGGLLDHATENLMDRFSSANSALAHIGPDGPLNSPPSEMRFSSRLRSCNSTTWPRNCWCTQTIY